MRMMRTGSRTFIYRFPNINTGAQTWTGVTQTSSMAPQRDVAHWDVTTGHPGVDPWPGASTRDLVYISTHGGPGGMRFWSMRPEWPTGSTHGPGGGGTGPNLFRRLDQNGAWSNMGPCRSEWVNWEIGSTWKSGRVGTRTNSRWNQGLKWAFLASCSQLSASNNSRRNYARTLLGEPQRAHGIFGYDHYAPSHPTDLYVANRFFHYARQGNSIRFSWMTANHDYRQWNAACVLHAAHQFEGLPPARPVQGSTSVWSTPDIRYWYINWLRNITGATTPVAHDDSQSWWRRAVAGLRGAFGTDAAVASDTPRLLQGKGTTYRLLADIPEAVPEDIAPLRAVPAPALPPNAVARGILESPDSVEDAFSYENAQEFAAGQRRMLVFDEDAWNLWEGFEYGTEDIGLTPEEAIEVASGHVRSTARMPEHAVAHRVASVESASVDLFTGDSGPASTHAYIVEYRQIYDDLLVTGAGQSISVTVARDGACAMDWNWRGFERVEGQQPGRMLSADAALDSLARHGERVLDLPAEVDVVDVQLVYYAPKGKNPQDRVWPAWEFTLDGDVGVHVCARTGRVLVD